MTPTGRKNYAQLSGYCWKLTGELYRDLLHDAYLEWYKKTGTNLFEQPNRLGTKVIRHILMNEQRSRRYMWKGGLYPKIFCEAVAEKKPMELGYAPRTNVTPHDHAYWETDIKPEIGYEFGMVLDGYSQLEIANITGKSPQLISYHIRKNKKKLIQLLNPIAGSRVRLVKKLSKKQFESLEDKDEYKNTFEGNDTVDIYVKDIEAYEATGTTEGILVKLTKD